MIFERFIIAVTLSCSFLSILPVNADTEIITRKTTTVTSSGGNIVLPSGNYILVDPISGIAHGSFDPANTTALTTLPSGLVVIDKSSGKFMATLDSGRLVDIATYPSTTNLINSINARETELQNIISDSLAKGTIDSVQAASLRGSLDEFAAKKTEAARSEGVLTYSEALALAVDLNNLADKIVASTHVANFAPLVRSRLVVTNGRVLMMEGL